MSFDRLAPHYRWMEAVLAGGLLQRARLQWIDAVPPPERVVLVGEGPGRFLEAALSRWGRARFWVVDASAPMLERARRAWVTAGGAEDRVTWLQVSLPSAALPVGDFDLLATHFFLDCFPTDLLCRVVSGLGRAATADASWLITDFRVAEVGWRRWRSHLLLALMYAFFRWTTRLPARRWVDPDPILRAAGFRLEGRRTFNQGFVHADWWRRADSCPCVPA